MFGVAYGFSLQSLWRSQEIHSIRIMIFKDRGATKLRIKVLWSIFNFSAHVGKFLWMAAVAQVCKDINFLWFWKRRKSFMHCKFSTRGDWQGVGCKALSTWCAVDILIYKMLDENIMEGCLCNEVPLKKEYANTITVLLCLLLVEKGQKSSDYG